jgi:hypothetical protein
VTSKPRSKDGRLAVRRGNVNIAVAVKAGGPSPGLLALAFMLGAAVVLVTQRAKGGA